MPPQFLAMILMIILGASIYFAKMMLDNRHREMELRAKLGEPLDGAKNKSVTETELVSMIRDAVREETAVVLDRLQEVEERVDEIDGRAPDDRVLGLEDETVDNERKTLGRTTRTRS